MKAALPPTVVTVTYGDRWHLLEKVLQGCFSQGVREIIVVDNASVTPIESLSSDLYPGVDVIRLPRNAGSATGFKSGIERALQNGSDYILLLDDDNVPAPGSIAKLCTAMESSMGSHSGPVAVLGNRTHSAAGSEPGIEAKVVRLRPASFLGFHVYDIPGKVMRRLRKHYPATDNRNASPLIKTEACTYGGLLFHRSLVNQVGLPREDFILYMDDYEFTYRLTSSGGSILLVADAGILDLEMQWNAGTRFSNSLQGWLLGEGDMRAYYTARNRSYFEMHLQPKVPWLRRVNKGVYLALLRLAAWRTCRQVRLRLLLQAIADGENGRMGMNQEFSL